MGTDKMKPLLALSKRDPVQAAIGLTSDGEAIILLDKKAKPKKVLSMMRGIASKAKINLAAASLRFGRAEVDTDYDSGCVRFFVNKETPGNMRPKLVEIVKRIAYQKVEINVDPSLEEESEEEEAQEATATETAAGPVAPQEDAAALKRRLTALVQRIPAVLAADPSRKDGLLALAKDGQTHLAANDLAATTTAIDKLQQALDVPAPPPQGQAQGNTVQYAKARLAWIAVRKQMEGDLEKLRANMLQFYEDADIASQLNRSFSEKVEPVLAALDESLADLLDDATNASDPAKRAEFAAQAKTMIGKYQAFIGSEPLFKELDGNPFVKLNTSATMTKTLATLAAAV
jgi:hypothetical protein